MGLLVATATAIVITWLIATIEVPYKSNQAATVRACWSSGPFFLYGSILSLGNVISTLLASVIMQDQVHQSLRPLAPLLYAFFGVFAFEGVLSNTNVTVFDRGVLTIQDWITKARDYAVAGAIKRQVQLDDDQLLKTVQCLMKLDEAQLHAYIEQYLGPGSVHELNEQAVRSSSDRRRYKALALSTKRPREAAAICRQLLR